MDTLLKNIPLPTLTAYKKKLIEKTEKVIRRMRWRALFFLQENGSDEESSEMEDEHKKDRKETFGFKTRNCPPKIEESQEFEEELLQMIENVQFHQTSTEFQKQLKEDIKTGTNSNHLFISADKTRNMYEVERNQYLKLLQDNASKHYKTAPDGLYEEINRTAKSLAENLNIADRVDTLAKSEAYIKLKDHKDNFERNIPCRLINPAKSEI